MSRAGILLALVACSSSRQVGCQSTAGTPVTGAVVDDKAGAGAPAAVACPRYHAGVVQGRLGAPALVEASGLAVSRRRPGVLWSHNDSDEGPRLYALSESGTPLGIYSLAGAKLRDWEAIAIGPGPDPARDYLYVGDIGDNHEKHKSLRVYRVPEPPVDPAAPAAAGELTGVERFEFTYPDGRPRDAETLIVDPLGADLYIITKSNDGHSQVFRAAAPLASGSRTVLEAVAELDFGADGRVTGGAVSATGDWIVVRTRKAARMWPRPARGALWQAFQGGGCAVPVAAEPQGEAIAFAATGLDYFTVSEGARSPIYRYARADE